MGAGPKKPGGVHTVPDKDGLGWANKQDGKTLSRHHTKAAAEEIGRREAKRDEVEHSIHRKDGTIGEKNSYGGDEFPPEG